MIEDIKSSTTHKITPIVKQGKLIKKYDQDFMNL